MYSNPLVALHMDDDSMIYVFDIWVDLLRAPGWLSLVSVYPSVKHSVHVPKSIESWETRTLPTLRTLWMIVHVIHPALPEALW